MFEAVDNADEVPDVDELLN